jgi:hypothetical protein
MRIVAGASVVMVLFLVASVRAQQADSSTSVERVRLALENSQPPRFTSPILPPWIAPVPTRLGTLTLLPPQTNGQFVSVVVPVGDLVMRAVHTVSAGQHRRAERKAHEEVLSALQDFQAQLSSR